MHRTPIPHSHLRDRQATGKGHSAHEQEALADAQALIASCGGADQALAAIERAAAEEAQRRRGLPLKSPP